jgi:Family of unknown function (DUF6445)
MVSFTVIDDFLVNPDFHRSIALTKTFNESQYYKGFRATDPFYTQEIESKIRSVMIQSHKPSLSRIDWLGSSFLFHYSVAGTPEVFHADPSPPLGDWAGVLYLKPNAPIESGTSLFRHRKTGINTGDPSAFSTQPPPYCYLDPTEWEETDFVGNIYNRLIIFKSNRIHSMRKPFGYNMETSRLTQLFFFNLH